MSDKEKERIQQRIYLSRKSLNSLEFEYEVLKIPLKPGEETSFELLVINHGEPTHVHFSLGKEMRDKVMIMKDKVYVIESEKVAAIVRLPKTYAGAVDTFSIGEIYVSSGYGASKRGFAVEIVEPKEKEAVKEAGVKEEEEQEAQERTEKKDIVRSPDERELLAHLATSACAVILFAVLLIVMRLFSQSSPALLFVNALIASLLFLFIVIYNL